MTPRFRSLVILVVAVLAGAAWAACHDSPVAPAGSQQNATIPVRASVSDPEVSTVVVEVTASDITDPFVFNFDLVSGTLDGEIRIPAGTDRTITARAFAADGTQTHEGSVTTDVKPGQNPPLTFTLHPRPGKQPITIVLGEFTIAVDPLTATIDPGQTQQFTATVTGAGGESVDADIQWASSNPAVASVDPTGLASGIAQGGADIVATFAGVGAKGTLGVGALPPASGRILFTRDTNGDDVPDDIYVMNADGSGQTNLSNDPGAYDGDPVWSPDGTRIAFVSDRNGGEPDVFVMNADGSAQVDLTNDPTATDQHLAWSPDGSQIAFTSNANAIVDVVVAAADGSSLTMLTDAATDGSYTGNTQPAWSPDGSRIAFVSDRSSGSHADVFVMNADGSGQTNLTNDPNHNYAFPEWSPDGSRIAFSSTDYNGSTFTYTGDLFVMNADGTGQVNLTDDPSSLPFVVHWSPDGTLLAFEADGDVYVIGSDGTGLTNLTNDPVASFTNFDGIAWSPDGSRIAFPSDRDGNEEIFVVGAAGGPSTQLTTTASPVGNSPHDWHL